mmetsp:Transcript_34298/g.110161  ORF Transcript_34298/g.110161 Transcript_34298/m.110161 type:complete len:237 (+) Transcript_34298:170-880(+)
MKEGAMMEMVEAPSDPTTSITSPMSTPIADRSVATVMKASVGRTSDGENSKTASEAGGGGATSSSTLSTTFGIGGPATPDGIGGPGTPFGGRGIGMGGGSPGKKPVASLFIASPLLERPMAPWLDMRAGRTPGVISNLSRLSSRPSVTAASIDAGCAPVALSASASAPPQHVLRASSTMEAIDWRSAMAWIGNEKMVTKERPIRAALMMGEAGYEERMLERTREPKVKYPKPPTRR